ncbi:LysR family transcriptional regulator [Bradyrhizobium elkanii]|uniref:LysR family transcriptional regulator n=1 Tax=Bradyrhizobium elkanii TaxID=29448 RepID=UPI001BAD5F5E|nr:LysR family transcriptional regulator [Bradyrhizobium elkanii]MBR1159464.1 LysR family transcriptional regulator [Bradyrhizobium elkanii]
MDLRQLRYFVSVADSGSISAAAVILHVAQSAVSRQILRLEDEVGGVLFQRSITGVELTETGHVLLERARFILREIESATNDVSTYSRGMRGTVRMAAPASAGRVLYVPLVQRFHAQFPQVQLELSEGTTDEMLRSLAAGTLDLGLVTEVDPREDVMLKPLLREEAVLLAPVGNPLSKRKSIVARDLPKLPIIIAPGLRRIFEERYGALRPVVQIHSSNPAAELTRSGVGYAVVPKSALSTPDVWRGLQGVPVRGLNTTRMMAWGKGRPASLAARALRAAVEQLVCQRIEEKIFLPV